MKPILLLLLTLIALACQAREQPTKAEPVPTCADCPACPDVIDVDVVPTGTFVPAPPEPPLSAWPEVSIDKLVGKWRAETGEPIPSLEVVQSEEGSKTPFNLDLRSRRPAFFGCGAYPSGAAWCAVYEKVNDPTEPSIEHTVSFKQWSGRSDDGLRWRDVLWVQLAESEAVRFEGTFVREDGAK